MADREANGRKLGTKLAQGLRIHAQEVRAEHDVDLKDVMHGAAAYLDDWLEAQALVDSEDADPPGSRSN